jgi:hypothetical protein
MKHLKSITEAFEFDTQLRKVKELGELNLSYLEDEGYIINYKVTDAIIQYRDIVIEISRVDRNIFSGYLKKDLFSWSDVKDRVIPLVTQLNKDFNVEVEIFDGSSIGWGDYKNHTTDWVINDGPSRWFAPNTIRFIKIKLKSYLFKKGAKL